MLTLVLVSLVCTLVIGVFRPHQGSKFQWQLESDKIDTSVNADIYDIDLWTPDDHGFHLLKSRGKKIICYFSAGTYDLNRPDHSRFPDSVKGKTMDDWPGEKWIDIRSHTVRSIMKDRIKKAHDRGCDGIEPDNVDGYDSNQAGFHFSYSNQLDYNKFLATEAHKLGLSVGLKNDIDQIHELEPYFDWALNEQCHKYHECDSYRPFLEHGKAVFNVEYVHSHHVSSSDRSQKCSKSSITRHMDSQIKTMSLTSWATFC